MKPLSNFWLWFVPVAALVALMVACAGCTARPMVCIPIRLDGGPALGCADASAVKGSRIEPWDGVPAPTLPERDLKDESCKGYWKYDGCYKDQKETRE